MRGIAAVLAAFAASAAALSPTQDWSKVPTFANCGNATGTIVAPFSNDTLSALALHAQFVTVAGTQGSASSAKQQAEKAIQAAAQQLKAASSNLPVYFSNSMEWVNPHYQSGQYFDQHPENELHNADGSLVEGKGASAGFHAFDLSVKQAQQWWLELMVGVIHTDEIDGLYIGDLDTDDGYLAGSLAGCSASKQQAWLSALNDTMLLLIDLLPHDIPTICSPGADRRPGCTAVDVVEFDGSADKMAEMQGLAASTSLAQVRLATGGDTQTELFESALAGFLIAASEGQYFGPSASGDCSWWGRGLRRAELQHPLGEPKGPASKDSNGVWTRTFATGTSVTYKPDSQQPQVCIRWSDGQTTGNSC